MLVFFHRIYQCSFWPNNQPPWGFLSFKGAKGGSGSHQSTYVCSIQFQDQLIFKRLSLQLSRRHRASNNASPVWDYIWRRNEKNSKHFEKQTKTLRLLKDWYFITAGSWHLRDIDNISHPQKPLSIAYDTHGWQCEIMHLPGQFTGFLHTRFPVFRQ